MQFQTVIEDAGHLLKKSELGHLNSIVRAWNGVEWKEVPHAQGLAAPHDKERNTINLFGGLAKANHIEQLEAVVGAFGVLVFTRMAPEPAQKRWEWKLTLPEAHQVDQVQEKLKDGNSFKSYRSIMESFDRLMDRYVSLNLTNALAAVGIKRQQAININLRQWGNTLGYANIRKFHSLRPYVTAYGPREAAECPGQALAEKLVYNMRHVTESSLAESFGRLIVEVFRLCREEPRPAS